MIDPKRQAFAANRAIIAGNPVEIRPRLVESVLAAGGKLQNMSDGGPSLEDLFLRLTGADAEAADDRETDDPPETP